MTIVEVDRRIGVESFATTADANNALISWLDAFGHIDLVGVEGTGSYGASLARALARRGVPVVEVDQPNRQRRRQAGKSDPIDAVEAARAAQGRARGLAKSRTGNVEAIRALTIARRSAQSVRVLGSSCHERSSGTSRPTLQPALTQQPTTGASLGPSCSPRARTMGATTAGRTPSERAIYFGDRPRARCSRTCSTSC